MKNLKRIDNIVEESIVSDFPRNVTLVELAELFCLLVCKRLETLIRSNVAILLNLGIFQRRNSISNS